MAGSWGHLVWRPVPDGEAVTEDPSVVVPVAPVGGKPYRSRDGSFPLIENMGDAVEALEECYGMVWRLASQLAAARGWDTDDRVAMLDVIEDARSSYEEGYRLGAGEDPRW